jgi:hypothetical protein
MHTDLNRRLDALEREVRNHRRAWRGLLVAAAVVPLALSAATISYPNTFANGTVANADAVNANFTAVATAVADNDSRIAALESGGAPQGDCPAGMARVANDFCIHTSSPYSRGMTWHDGLQQCHDDGFRMCSQTEVVTALHAGVLEKVPWPTDTWYTNASQAETSPGQTGENTVCDVQGNSNQPSHPDLSVQCNHGTSATSSWRTLVCCSG